MCSSDLSAGAVVARIECHDLGADVRVAVAETLAAHIAFEQAGRDHERISRLSGEGFASPDALEKARRDLDLTRSALIVARERAGLAAGIGDGDRDMVLEIVADAR